MSILQAIILGIVQGLTELLPISSSAHLNLIPWILNWTSSESFNQAFEAFDVALHAGTLLAIGIFFFKDWLELIKGGFNQVVKKEKLSRDTYSAHKDQGGGVRIDLIHEWDYILGMFGKPEKVYSLSGKYSDLEIDSEDLSIYIAKYPDKLVELHLDYFGRYVRRNLELRTIDNEYIFDIAYNRIYKNNHIVESFEEDGNDKYIREMRFFYNIIKGKARSTNDLYEALETMKVAEENAEENAYVE